MILGTVFLKTTVPKIRTVTGAINYKGFSQASLDKVLEHFQHLGWACQAKVQGEECFNVYQH